MTQAATPDPSLAEKNAAVANAADTNLEKLRAIEADIVAGKFAAATAAINAMIAATPADPRVYLSAAMLAHAAKNPQQELVALQHAVSLAPRWPLAYVELAKVFSRQGDHGKAVAAADKAVELAPLDMHALEVAVAVANSAGDVASAERYLQSALALRPGDLAIRRSLGVCLDRRHRYAEAEPHWRAIVAEYPDDASALGWLGTCLIGLGRKEEAREMLERALVLAPDHPTLPFHLAVARGETPTAQPPGMVQQLFDEYAERFDTHLVEYLKYDLPKRVARMIRDKHPDLAVSVLDLGCGTGLLAASLGRIGGAFVGVDLSRKMLEQAMRLQIYTRLRMNDLLDELRLIEAESFDYVTANDVFIYVGDVSAVIPAIHRVLQRGGKLIFSCETALESEGALVLRPSRRYAHSLGSIEAMCRDAGFSFSAEPIVLRKDGVEAAAITGFLGIANKA